MKISDGLVKLLTEYSIRPVDRRGEIHPEDMTIYSLGLQDGVTLSAQEILAQLKPEAVVAEELESE